MHHTARQRANKTATRAELVVLPPEDRAAIEVPELPSDRLWDPKTSDWWVDAWQSPMRLEWDPVDHHTLTAIAYLLDEFYIEAGKRAEGAAPDVYKLTNLSSSITAKAKTMGLDPFARRSLQWMLVQTERDEAALELTREKTKAKRSKATAKKSAPKKRGLGGMAG